MRGNALSQIALATILILSFIWLWRQSFPGSTAVFAIAILVLLLFSHWQRRDTLHDLGFRLDTAPGAAAFLVPVAIAAIAVTLFAGYLLGSVRFPPARVASIAAGKLIAFGILQQYVLLGFYYRGVVTLVSHPLGAILVTASLFAIFHFPNPFLMVVTFSGAVIAAAIYRRSPNLWVSGFVHGLISYCLYYSVPRDVSGGLRVGPDFWMS